MASIFVVTSLYFYYEGSYYLREEMTWQWQLWADMHTFFETTDASEYYPYEIFSGDAKVQETEGAFSLDSNLYMLSFHSIQ